MGTTVLLGLLWAQHKPGAELSHSVWFMVGFVTFALVVTLWALSYPQESPLRRILGIIADNAAITYFMLLMGESGALVVGLYMFVAFGNAFRFGPLYSRISHATALAGFTFVLFASDFWSNHIQIGLGLLIALLILPLYVGVLIERLKAEWLKVEQELKECRDALRECRARERDES
jgi:two-component system sensor histidine kinase RpfC